jgi:hypothetical protein
MLIGEAAAANTNFKVFGYTRPWLDLPIYLTGYERDNHYITCEFQPY